MKKYRLQLYCFQPDNCEEYAWVNVDHLGMPHEMLSKMEDMGIISLQDNFIRVDHIRRIYQALRLQKTLGVNLAGAGVILELLGQVESLQEELEELKRML